MNTYKLTFNNGQNFKTTVKNLTAAHEKIVNYINAHNLQSCAITCPNGANFDATLREAGFRASTIAGHYVLPESWTDKERFGIANMGGIDRYSLAFPISRATAMQCLCLYVENFAG